MSRDRGFPVETPIGTMFLRHVGWGVLIDNSSNTIPEPADAPYLTMDGKQFTATVGVYPDGLIERLYVSKVTGPWTHVEATPKYRRRVLEVARETALQWIEDHPEEVARGEHYRAEMDVYSAKADVDRLRPEYFSAQRRLRAANEELRVAKAALKKYEVVA